jgi:hypothetical protein
VKETVTWHYFSNHPPKHMQLMVMNKIQIKYKMDLKYIKSKIVYSLSTELISATFCIVCRPLLQVGGKRFWWESLKKETTRNTEA